MEAILVLKGEGEGVDEAEGLGGEVGGEGVVGNLADFSPPPYLFLSDIFPVNYLLTGSNFFLLIRI